MISNGLQLIQDRLIDKVNLENYLVLIKLATEPNFALYPFSRSWNDPEMAVRFNLV